MKDVGWYVRMYLTLCQNALLFHILPRILSYSPGSPFQWKSLHPNLQIDTNVFPIYTQEHFKDAGTASTAASFAALALSEVSGDVRLANFLMGRGSSLLRRLKDLHEETSLSGGGGGGGGSSLSPSWAQQVG